MDPKVQSAIGLVLVVLREVDLSLLPEVDLGVQVEVVPVVLLRADLGVVLEVVPSVDHLAEEVRCTVGQEVVLVALHEVGQVQVVMLAAGRQALSGVIGVQHQQRAADQYKGRQSQKDENRMGLLRVLMLNSLVRHSSSDPLYTKIWMCLLVEWEQFLLFPHSCC